MLWEKQAYCENKRKELVEKETERIFAKGEHEMLK